MKKSLLSVLVLASLASAHAQGMLQFRAHLTSTITDLTGDGLFTLTGNNFRYDVIVLY